MSTRPGREVPPWLRRVLWHGLVVGIALTVSAGLRWGISYYSYTVQDGGFWAVDLQDPSVALEGVGPVLILVCGLALLTLRNRP